VFEARHFGNAEETLELAVSALPIRSIWPARDPTNHQAPRSSFCRCFRFELQRRLSAIHQQCVPGIRRTVSSHSRPKSNQRHHLYVVAPDHGLPARSCK
jgi:hypothetical protein